MASLWFVLNQQQVSGPFSTKELSAKIESGNIPPKAKVWWRGQKNWIRAAEWSSQLPKLLKSDPALISHTGTWYFSHQGEKHGPMNLAGLIKSLKKFEQISQTKVWKPGLDHWFFVKDLPDVAHALGESVGFAQKASLDGNTVIERYDQTHISGIESIAVDHVTVMGADFLKTGDEIQIQIKSPSLHIPIYSHAKVRSVDDNGKAVLEFENLHSEAKNDIITYLRSQSMGHSDSVAA